MNGRSFKTEACIQISRKFESPIDNPYGLITDAMIQGLTEHKFNPAEKRAFIGTL